MAQNLVAALSVSHPVRPYRSAASQHLFGHHIPLQGGAFLASVLAGPHHADVAGLPTFAAEFGIAFRPGIFAWREAPRIHFALKECPNLLSQQLRTFGHRHCRKYKIMHVSTFADQ
jgi:hypothetical protein